MTITEEMVWEVNEDGNQVHFFKTDRQKKGWFCEIAMHGLEPHEYPMFNFMIREPDLDFAYYVYQNHTKIAPGVDNDFVRHYITSELGVELKPVFKQLTIF